MSFDSSAFLATLTSRPGVYRMLDEAGDILYVGKAKNLKNRVSSYFRRSAQDNKTMAMVARIRDVQVTVTRTETEALLLEQSQIKAWRPPFNILFKDDKSYPQIFVSTEDDYPRIAFHRGAQRRKGQYFGPFPSAYSVRDSLNVLEKAFLVRQCEDTYYANRTRPCLKYQIKRCSGPCCDMISKADYRHDVDSAIAFLEGKSQEVIGRYHERMDAASEQLDFERAAAYRDQISQLRKIQNQQSVVGAKGDIDVISVLIRGAGVVVLQMYIRGGRLLGSKSYFPEVRLDQSPTDVLDAFVPQHYLDDQVAGQLPQELVLSHALTDKAPLEEALESLKGSKVKISDRVRSQRREWLEIAEKSAEQALGTHVAKRDHVESRFIALDEALGVSEPLSRLECFDISHLQGEATVASCVVFDREGPRKADYRRFNIEDVQAGDDYGAMKQALDRRYARLKKGEAPLPDILFIDGGKGQLRQAIEVLESHGIEGVRLIGVAKGPSRKAGLEKLVEVDGSELVLPPDHPGLHLIQHIRDESHRFAITGHQQRRQKARNQSPLEGIPGVGPTRRRQLLRHFGGLKQILDATPDELAKAEGISRRLAREIYATLHP